MSRKFYLLRCGLCGLDMPFSDNEARSEWMAGHLSTGHETYLLWCSGDKGASK